MFHRKFRIGCYSLNIIANTGLRNCEMKLKTQPITLLIMLTVSGIAELVLFIAFL